MATVTSKLVRWVVTPRYYLPFRDVFWRSLITALMLPVAIWIANTYQAAKQDPSQMVRIHADMRVVWKYHSNAYWVNDRRVMLDCPTEDSCGVQYPGGGTWLVFKVNP